MVIELGEGEISISYIEAVFCLLSSMQFLYMLLFVFDGKLVNRKERRLKESQSNSKIVNKFHREGNAQLLQKV